MWPEMPETTGAINGDVRISLSSERKVGAHSSVTLSHDQFHTGLNMNGNSSEAYTTQEGDVASKHSYVTYHRQEETGGLIQTSVSPNKNHVTAKSVNSPDEVLRSFRREFKTSDTTRQAVPTGYRHERSVSARTQDQHLKENHYPSADNEVPHMKIAGQYEHAASDTEIPVRYIRPHNGELPSNRHFYSDGRIFENTNENRSRKERGRATRGDNLLSRHHSMDLSKRFYLTKKQKYPNLPSQEGYVYGNPDDYGNVYGRKDRHTYVRKFHPRIASHNSYPFAGHHSDTDNANDLDYSSFDVISLASSSDTDVFFAAESPDDNRKKATPQDMFKRKYTILSERDFSEPIPIYTHKHYWRDVTPIIRRHSTSRERPRRHSRARQVVLSRRSYDSGASDDYDDPHDSLIRVSHARRSTDNLRQKRPDTLSLSRNDPTSVKFTSLDNFSTVPYSLNTMPQGTLNTNFALYPYAGLSPTFQSSYAGFPFSPTSAYTNHLLRSNTLDFTTVRNYLDALGTSLASIPTPAIGTTPYISQQILQANIPTTLECAETQDLFANDNLNYNNTPADREVAYNNDMGMQPSDREATFNKGECLPVSSTSLVPGIMPSSSAEHLQGRVIKDTSGINRKYHSTDKHSQKVLELNPPMYHTNINRETSKLSSNPQTSTLFSGDTVGKTDKKAANWKDAEENDSKFKALQRQVSKELSARFLSNVNSTEKSVKMSPVQPDPGQHRSPVSIISSLPSVTEEPGIVSPVSDADRGLLNKLTSTDNHSQASKSPPATTFPELKCPGERPTGPASPSPVQQPAFPDSSNTPVRTSTAHNSRHLMSDHLPRSLGSNIFEISELRVIDMQENISRNSKHVTRKAEPTKNPKETSSRRERAGNRYSITQVCSHQTFTQQNMIHPEADYDVYPRRPAHLQDKPVVLSNINNQPQVSPTKVRFETPKPPQESYNISVKQMVNKFSTNTLASSMQNTTTNTPGESPLEFRDRQPKTSNSISTPTSYTGNQVTTASPLYKSQVSRNTLKSYSSLLESTEDPHRSLYKSQSDNYTPTLHSAKPSQRHLNRTAHPSPFSVQPNDADTDFRKTPYQFYTGPLSLQPTANNTNSSTADVALQNLTHNARNVFDEQFYNNTQKLRSDSINTKYIFYKGPITIPPATEESTTAVLNRTQQAPHCLNEDPTILNSERNQSTSLDTKINCDGENVHLETNKQRDIGVVNYRTVKTEVPIPPRDFDSDADSSEYIYTAKGWKHLQDRLSSANVMFCTSVQDSSAAIVRKLHLQTPKMQHPNESILEKFFRDCLPKNQHCVSDTTNVPNVERIFDWPFSDELSKSTVSLKWTSNMNFAHVQSSLQNPGFGDVHHGRRVNPGSSDLDSGVSLASQTSVPSVNDLNDQDMFNIIIPREDYSSAGSVTSCSSIQVGWDYLSWNDSVKQRKHNH